MLEAGHAVNLTAARRFRRWWAQETRYGMNSLVAFSDGSVGKEGKGYGFAIYEDGEKISVGKASMPQLCVVFDCEAVGAAQRPSRIKTVQPQVYDGYDLAD